MMAMAWMVSHDHPISGMCGGEPGSPYTNHFEVGSENERRIVLREQALQEVPAFAIHGAHGADGPARLL